MRWIVAGLALVATGLAAVAVAQDIPDALAVEWQGKHPCEKLYEDGQIRVARCTFPPGAEHVRHQHPAYLTYVLSGGQGEITTPGGKSASETRAGQLLESPAIEWHAMKNVGQTTIQYLVIEKKYPAKP